MKLRNALLAAVAVLVFAGSTVPANAQYDRHHHRHHHHHYHHHH